MAAPTKSSSGGPTTGEPALSKLCPARSIRMQRSIIRERARLARLRTIIKNCTHTLLDKHGYKSPYAHLFGKHGLEWLSKLELPAGDRILLDINLEQLDSLNRSIDRLTETIAISAIENLEVKLLMGFTGIDYYSAMLLINEIEPIARFSSPKKLVSYAGLAPSTRQSGNHTTHGPITKEASNHIRWTLVEVTQHATRTNPRLSRCYNRIGEHGGCGENHGRCREKDAGAHPPRPQQSKPTQPAQF